MNADQVKDEMFKVFMKWMRGQTCGVNADGSYNYYSHDVA